MQTTRDGQYIPSKELDTKFKISKKRPHEETFRPLVPQSIGVPQSIVQNSYYNVPTTPAPIPVPIPDPLVPTGPGPIIGTGSIEAAQTLILQNLQQREYERPKTYVNHILRDTIPDCFDESLPRELVVLFQPLYCKLCSAQLSSNVVAKLHYKSKNHEKKIRKFLIEYSEKTGEPIHKRARITPKVKQTATGEDNGNPLYFYCDVCDLPLTGKLHAESHYMGKNHRKATLGVRAPVGKGHFDSTGKWVRESSHKRPPGDLNDSFGQGFHQIENAAAAAAAVGFRCELCNITTTCQDQLQAHYNGQKHKKKLNKYHQDLGLVSPHDNILTSVLLNDAEKGDCSVYRTPSGQYYCQICNISSNSEPQFRQHLQSKSHLRNANTTHKI